MSNHLTDVVADVPRGADSGRIRFLWRCSCGAGSSESTTRPQAARFGAAEHVALAKLVPDWYPNAVEQRPIQGS